jgi:hypothetical protein
MAHIVWSERDSWSVCTTDNPRTHTDWEPAPGVPRYDCELNDGSGTILGRPFWCIGAMLYPDNRWWANKDATSHLHYFNTEDEARAFVEVMIRLDT